MSLQHSDRRVRHTRPDPGRHIDLACDVESLRFRYGVVVAEAVDLIDAFTKALGDRDVDRAVGLYATDAVVVRYEGVATGTDEIRAFLVGFLSSYERFEVVSVDQVKHSGDTMVWDASFDTGAGVLQTTNVFLLDQEGRIARHVPLLRGYWGRT